MQENSILDRINKPQDLKALSKEELTNLCEEVRDEIVNIVSKTGGHLGAGLGVIELTIALHYVFNAPDDKIIWD
ncbi:MAG: 1-deoxy-D-xylulose-5-phosphate synthase, partial [Alphaproteobacteria bacterium]|nr:1-deoxy-D-xylulose-5-phosphate synthase [Alphaproteobacteria bacterium]